MATVSGMPPIMRTRRSTQSGAFVMTAAWQVVYTENESTSLLPYFFLGAEINLSPMAAGDTIDIRIRKILVAAGAFTIHDQRSYSDARPATHPSLRIAGLVDVYGVEIAMRQTAVAAALLTIEAEFYDAKRLGLT